MPALVNSRHEKFARFCADGLAGSEAYRRIVGGLGKNADKNANEWMRRSDVRKRIAELKRSQSERSEMSRDEYRCYLIRVMTTPVGEIDEHDDLCQEVRVTGFGKQVKMPDKLKAAELLGKLTGWSTEKAELESRDTLAAFLQSIRQQNRPNGCRLSETN
jgi:hypothetical protein